MKIAFDHQAFSMQRFGGVSRYYVELAKELDKLHQEVKIFGGLYQNYYLPNLPKSLVNGIALKSYPKKTGTVFNYFNHFISQQQISSFVPDLIHETYYAFAKPAKIKAARVVTVHDMIHELFPESFRKDDPLSKFKKNALMKADHIISVSQNTKKDLVNLFQIAPEKISVIHLAVSPFESDASSLQNLNSAPYLLYVGARGGYKNFEMLVKAYAQSNALRLNFNLIAFGGGPFNTKEIKLIDSLGLSNSQVKHVSGSDEILVNLYQSATAFIYPSVYEGFGLPPLEAMSLGCPVVSSNTSSMPEVLGEAAAYFNPSDQEELIYTIENVVFSEAKRKMMIEKGRERVLDFSWAKTAKATLEVYQKLV